MIDKILSLAAPLEKAWNREGFPKQSLEALNSLELPQAFADLEASVAKWLLETDKLPPQVNLYNSFGEPPVTIFNNGKFALDIYFWRKNDTLIHSHAFRGAFKVLYGQSLHEQFQVKVLDSVDLDSADDDIVFSNLTDSKKSIMSAGSTQVINPGMDLVHRVVHLDNPTVTLCIRTVEDLELDQWHHLPTGISYQKHNLKEETIKRILYFEFMYASDQTKALDFLNNMISKMKTSAQLDLYESLFMNELGLDYDVTCVVLDKMKDLFSSKPNTKWFKQYEEHFGNIAQELDEHQVKGAGAKLLAHAINKNYSKTELKQLLGEVTTETSEDLAQQLIDSPIFSDEHYNIQVEKINLFISELAYR